MIIEDYNQCKIYYSPWEEPTYNDEGQTVPSNVPPHKMSCDVKCFNLTKAELPDELHLGVAPSAYNASGFGNEKEDPPFYDIRLKNYSIYSQNYQFMYNLFKVMLKFQNGELSEDYDFRKENAECLV